MVIPFVMSVQPQTNIFNGDFGIDIAYPKYNFVLPNVSFNLNLHVYNASFNYLDNTTTDCYTHIFNPSGQSIYNEIGNFTTETDGGEFIFLIPSIVFSLKRKEKLKAWSKIIIAIAH